MPTVAVFQRSFAGGELARSLDARADQAKSATGAEEMTNMTVMRHGGAQSRPGFGFIATVKLNNTNAKLFRFEKDDTQTYTLEIGYDASYANGFGTVTGSGYMRVVRDGGQLVVPAQAAWASGHGTYNVTEMVSKGGHNYYCSLTHASAVGNAPDVAAGADYWYLMPDNPIVAGGSIYEIPAPYAAADIEWLYPRQSLDVVWFACRNPETLDDYPPYELRRTAHTAWEFRLFQFLPLSDGPDLGTLTPVVGAGGIVLRYYVTTHIGGETKESLPGFDTLSAAKTITTVGVAGANVNHVAHGLATGDLVLTKNVVTVSGSPNALLKKVLERAVVPITRVDADNFTLDGTGPITYVGNSHTLTWAKAYLQYSAAALPTSAANKNVITWAAVAGAQSYNIYRSTDGSVPGFIGSSTALSFTDDGIQPDLSDVPPTYNPQFLLEDKRPGIVGLYQQRLFFGCSNNDLQTIWGSVTGDLNNFTKHDPLQDDDSTTTPIVGDQSNEARHIVGQGQMVVLTRGSKWLAQGDAQGAIRAPEGLNLKPQGFGGASVVRPVMVQENALYVQALGSIVRDLREELEGYRGRDLTVYAAHLFGPGCGCGLIDAAYAEIPDSIAWFVRADGDLLGLTYIREHDIWGWHRHETDGLFKSIVVVTENSLSTLYAIIEREVNGSTVRYIERMMPRCGACAE